MKTSEIYLCLSCVLFFLAVAASQLQRARDAERREKQYRQMCDDLHGALKRQGDALQNLMTATAQLRNAPLMESETVQGGPQTRRKEP